MTELSVNRYLTPFKKEKSFAKIMVFIEFGILSFITWVELVYLTAWITFVKK